MNPEEIEWKDQQIEEGQDVASGAALSPPPYPEATQRYSISSHTRDPSISHRDFFVLSQHLAGKKAEEIAELMGYASAQSIYMILRKKEVLLVRQLLLEGLELEFETLQREVFEVIEGALRNGDDKLKMEAVDKWFRYFGKYKVKESKEKEITAEDVVKKLLQVNVQVNVGEPGNGNNR